MFQTDNDIAETIQLAKEKEGAFAFFRLPHTTTFTFLAQMSPALPLASAEELGKQTGFVVAPFAATEEAPLLLLRPEHLSHRELPPASSPTATAFDDEATDERTAYHHCFRQAQELLAEGNIQKIVLARSKRLRLSTPPSPEALFVQACRNNPHSFVALWWTPQTGHWLTATPEVLLEAEHKRLHTMALAGTMCESTPHADRLDGWSDKNRREHDYVRTYLTNVLSDVADEVEVGATRPIRAGGLMHLCTDFRFVSPLSVGALAQRLHPTPAVCGTPTDAARLAITAIETKPRRYYAGYCGPHLLNGETHLYVSLRCMYFDDKQVELFAGGGLLSDSREENEWEETCRKMQTMLHLLQTTTTR